jgi:hypothetical protein
VAVSHEPETELTPLTDAPVSRMVVESTATSKIQLAASLEVLVDSDQARDTSYAPPTFREAMFWRTIM